MPYLEGKKIKELYTLQSASSWVEHEVVTNCFDVFSFVLFNALTAPFKNMRTLKFKAQPANFFFTTVKKKFGGSSQLPTVLNDLISLQ